MQTTAIYSDETCSGPSRNVLVVSNDDCAAQACSPRAFGNNTDYYQTVTCFSTDSFSYDPMEDLFLGKTFIEGQVYNNTNCSDDSYWFRLGLIVGGCEPFTTSYNNSVTATLSSDGSASMLLYNNTECMDPPMTTYALGNTTLAKHLCYEGISNTGLKQHIARYFIHQDYDTGSTGSDTKTTDSGSSSHTTVSIVSGIVAAFVVVLAIAAVIFSRRQKKRKHEQMDETLAVMETRFTTTEAMFYRPGKADFTVSSQSTMPSDRSWDDDVIVAARIPRDKVILETLVSRGAFGEVYKGTYNGQVIAAKMLLVDTRRSIPHVNAFMAEVKIAAVMDHPHIAKFIGVAWDSLSDLCSVTEFMEGGDLKALLTKYEEEGHSLGFDYIKIRIALHVAHALTYLHSLDPPVIHRDLKSRNILLSQDMEAKLTDFGISRERIDATMTAGVGTSLWMAPEIMMGNQYNEMADMFSFGVVLSELSTHAAPYSHVKLRSSSLQPMPRTVILQNVAAGKLSVDFSDEGPNSMVELGQACVAMDPRDRPTAAEALYRLHKVLTLEFQVE
ncbi:Dual specificity protein kinase shkD [Phytophthora citrophthora]|uniref:Dual specificity protein kinase shkD n=1 Tax=Phytophthora citrophthora TaxID=4793 RepID=A0AAD9GX65_9STRA|nr:Dual specificity protein kinase shkD [Phytophthora citrophthora]